MSKPRRNRPGRTLSVDFGTTTVLVGLSDGSGAREIKEIGPPEARFRMPSVAEVRDGRLIAGGNADDPARAIRSVKSDITSGATEDYAGFSTDDVVAAILQEAVKLSSVDLNAISEVRLGCPAHWDRAQRERLVQNALSVGLPNVSIGSIYDEASSAGVSWVLEQWRHGPRYAANVLVLDFGGGTADVALLTVQPDDEPGGSFKVLSARGSGGSDRGDSQSGSDKVPPLGGDDIDKDLAVSIRGLSPDWSESERLYHIRVAREALTNSEENEVAVGPTGSSSALLTRRDVDRAVAKMMERVREELVLPTLKESLLKFKSFDDFDGKQRGSDDTSTPNYVGLWDTSQIGATNPLTSSDLPFSLKSPKNVVLVAGGLSRMPQVIEAVSAWFDETIAIAQRDDSLIEPEQAIVSGLMQFEESGLWTSLALPSIELVVDGRVIRPSHETLLQGERYRRGDFLIHQEYEIPGSYSPMERSLQVRFPGGQVSKLADLRSRERKSFDSVPIRTGPDGRSARIKFYAFGHIAVIHGSGGSADWYDTVVSTPAEVVPQASGGPSYAGTPGDPG